MITNRPASGSHSPPSTTSTASAQAAAPSGRPARDDKDAGRRPECRHWIGTEGRHCKEVAGVRRYLPGFLCPRHTPNALQGKAEFPPGPGWPIYREETP